MLGAGWALIDARIGSSRPHSHVAHQISLAVERDLEISGDADMIVPAGHAIAIASHVRHRLGPPGALVRSFYQIGRAHVCTPVTNAHLVCRLLLEKKKHQ